MFRIRIVSAAGLIFCVFLAAAPVRAEVAEYHLIITRQQVSITGEPAKAMTINGGIPGPTLRFKEGDTARVHVHNRMDVETSVHWHGVLVPNNMDGVPHLTYPPIKPGETFTYEFPVRQSGTYWYHSHTDLQEQSGVYGSIVIEPRQKRFSPDRDHVIVLSDWTNEDPHEVLRTLKRGSDWYAIEKGSGQSILGAARLGMLGEYFARELQRMPAMDVSDVAYDRFLANGRPESTLPGRPGETILLRIIDGSSASFFHLSYAGGPMTIVGADGQDVEPVDVGVLLIGIAETYDLLIRVPAEGAYEFRATAHDASGFASVWIGVGERHAAPAVPRPNLYHTMMDHLSLNRIFAYSPAGAMGMADRDVEAGRFDEPGMMGMGSMETEDTREPEGGDRSPGTATMDHSALGHHGMDASARSDLAPDGMDPRRPWPPYGKLRATKPTAFSVDRLARRIRLTLDGDMERFVWFINNKPLSESDSIRIHKGEVVQFVMINRTMMHHPMHLHGHFFRVLNGQGDYSPLKHTVDVPPMSTTVIEFDADELGDWFFHCHVLYHMMSGMAGVLHYEGFELPPDLAAIRPVLYTDMWYFWGELDAMSHMGQGFFTASNSRNMLTADWQYGWQHVEKAHWELTLTWGRCLNRFTTIFAGADLDGLEHNLETHNGVFGCRYLLPLNIESMAWIDTNGGFRFAAGKALQFTPRLTAFGNAEFDTETKWESRVGLSYTVSQSMSLVCQWHADYGAGGGIRVRF